MKFLMRWRKKSEPVPLTSREQYLLAINEAEAKGATDIGLSPRLSTNDGGFLPESVRRNGAAHTFEGIHGTKAPRGFNDLGDGGKHS